MPQGKGTYGSQVGRPPKKGKKAAKKSGSSGAKRAGTKDTYERQFGVKPQSLQDYKDWKTMQEIKKKKYQEGGSVDPFSLKNPEGVLQKTDEDSMPTTNAMERSQVFREGGKIEDWKEEGYEYHTKMIKDEILGKEQNIYDRDVTDLVKLRGRRQKEIEKSKKQKEGKK